MEKANEKIIKFLKENPNSDKTTMAAAVGIKGLELYNLLRKMESENIVITDKRGQNVRYALKETTADQPGVEVVKEAIERNYTKFKFNGEEYGKGQLVRAVVRQYVTDNPTVTYKQLKEAFPDDLLYRFGIFQDEQKAREISGKYDRYFFKPEHIIKLKDKKIVVCNQFTATNIQPFLKLVKSLGYKIK